MLVGEKIGEFNCWGYLEEKTLLNDLQIKYRYSIRIWCMYVCRKLWQLAINRFVKFAYVFSANVFHYMVSDVGGKYHTLEIFDRGNFWWTVYIDKRCWQRKIWRISYSQWIYVPNTFLVYLWILARKILVNSWRFAKFAKFFPTKYPCVWYRQLLWVSHMYAQKVNKLCAMKTLNLVGRVWILQYV